MEAGAGGVFLQQGGDPLRVVGREVFPAGEVRRPETVAQQAESRIGPQPRGILRQEALEIRPGKRLLPRHRIGRTKQPHLLPGHLFIVHRGKGFEGSTHRLGLRRKCAGWEQVLQVDVEGVQREGGYGAVRVGICTGEGRRSIVDGQDLDNTQAGTGRPVRQRLQVGEFPDAEPRAAAQREDGDGHAGHPERSLSLETRDPGDMPRPGCTGIGAGRRPDLVEPFLPGADGAAFIQEHELVFKRTGDIDLQAPPAGAVPRRFQRKETLPVSENGATPGQGRPERAIRIGETRENHLHHLQRYEKKGGGACLFARFWRTLLRETTDNDTHGTQRP